MACLRDDLKPVILGRPTGVANVVIGVSFEFRRRRYDFVFSQRQLYTMHLTTFIGLLARADHCVVPWLILPHTIEPKAYVALILEWVRTA